MTVAESDNHTLRAFLGEATQLRIPSSHISKVDDALCDGSLFVFDHELCGHDRNALMQDILQRLVSEKVPGFRIHPRGAKAVSLKKRRSKQSASISVLGRRAWPSNAGRLVSPLKSENRYRSRNQHCIPSRFEMASHCSCNLAQRLPLVAHFYCST